MHSKSYSVLVIDDEKSILKLLERELATTERSVETAASGRAAREKLNKKRFDVIISDIRLPDADGLDLLTEFRSMYPDVEIILITGHGDIDNAVEAMRIGAYDYIPKPFNLDRIELVVERAYQRSCLQRENRTYRHSKKSTPPSKLIGNSSVVKHLRFLINKVAPTEVPVLITGESGAGKDVVAHSIQSASARSEKPFIIKNCATLQKELIRSELFGHTRGSFTGATDDREGLLGFADTGTLFLDEIGELPLELQGSLLRVLEARRYRRVGEKTERCIDIRFIFATSRNLAQGVEEGTFNEALYHRINVFNIQIPPLKERKEDLPLLAEHFLGRMAANFGQQTPTISDKAMQALLAYNWPGNVRELRNVLERSLILCENNVITDRALPQELVGKASERRNGGNGIFLLEEVEREHILRALNFFNGNRQHAAEALGIGRKTLYRKLEKYSIS
ncbi:sigma-54 dependent transcriptional regulator [Desulfovibrio mangrovi]|uniref:sigma-54-dependent transcriptional regulator n=1 Tax=Desulfovibrio mangrovi TaxID=2976983 RepID=UPI002245CFA1|nr:sigma-54 dependent transcriptional regulator [Desulfovibrio mangrovi]UZP68137.1 sigma-54 dependent transcriptional regulator [Desulfovibrio mangrovi]